MKQQPFHPAKTTTLVEASRPKSRILSNHIAESKSSVGAKPKLGPHVPRKAMNWFYPSVWVQIEAGCQAVGWPFRPALICCHLQRANPDQFATLRPQRISEWIDRSKGSSLHFTEYVQRMTGTSQAMEPGGHSSRIGILVGRQHVHTLRHT